MSEPATPEQRETERYPQIVRAIRDTPWAMLESAFETMVEVVARRLEGQQLSHEEIQARVGNKSASQPANLVGSVALIPISGAIIPKANLFTEMSGGTSLEGLRSEFRSALADEDVKAIVFDVDSPGGMAVGIPELASEILAARGQKPIVAVANFRAASAAYWLAAMADEFVASPSADVGSIGVFAAHKAVAGMEEKIGVKTTLIAEPPGKIEGNPFEPLSDEAEANLRDQVSETYANFIGDVAKGRGVTPDAVKSGYGEGRMLSAAKALKAGMVDRIDTLESVVARLQNPSGRARVANGTNGARTFEITKTTVTGNTSATSTTNLADEGARPFTDDVDEALRAFDSVVSRAEALRALTGTKRDQLAALVERGKGLLATQEETQDESPSEAEIEFELAAVDLRLRAL